MLRVNESDNPEEAKKNFIARQALGRLGTAEEIAALVTYLASNEVILLYSILFLKVFIFRNLVFLHNWNYSCDRWRMEHLDWKIIPHSTEICFIASIKQMNSFVSMKFNKTVLDTK